MALFIDLEFPAYLAEGLPPKIMAEGLGNDFLDGFAFRLGCFFEFFVKLRLDSKRGRRLDLPKLG